MDVHFVTTADVHFINNKKFNIGQGGGVVACLIIVSLQVPTFKSLTLIFDQKLTWTGPKKFNGGWGGGGVACLIIVSLQVPTFKSLTLIFELVLTWTLDLDLGPDLELDNILYMMNLHYLVNLKKTSRNN